MKKYKNDIILVGVILLIAIISLILFNVLSKKDDLKALVYYDDVLVETIELSDLGEEIVVYNVNAENGEVVIEAKHNAIRIVHANCDQAYCENVGFSSSTSKPIICIPNKIYIKLVSSKVEVDIEL
jgi:hypothetical protein